ncbi:MAG TPA: hypothetical protein DDY43_10940 [Synechococcales bacterium UBA10510]|jgi:hypothetical protein|nr:hypothetical protein [Synechococcales bacterium UBA10510]
MPKADWIDVHSMTCQGRLAGWPDAQSMTCLVPDAKGPLVLIFPAPRLCPQGGADKQQNRSARWAGKTLLAKINWQILAT